MTSATHNMSTTADATWRTSAQTTPQLSPLPSHHIVNAAARVSNGMSESSAFPGIAVLQRQQQPLHSPQRFAQLPDVHNPCDLLPFATTTTTTTKTSSSLPLYEEPAFRADLMRRSVFVFGLQTVEECFAVLQLFQTHCGPVAAAFRTTQYVLDDIDRSSRNNNNSNDNNNNNQRSKGNSNLYVATPETSVVYSSGVDCGCVVLCVAFCSIDGVTLARRLDNTAEVFERRFVVECALRFQHLAYQHDTLSPAALAAMAQHERLWQLLFSPTLGGVRIDWHAARAAAQRGEALLVTHNALCVGHDSGAMAPPMHSIFSLPASAAHTPASAIGENAEFSRVSGPSFSSSSHTMNTNTNAAAAAFAVSSSLSSPPPPPSPLPLASTTTGTVAASLSPLTKATTTTAIAGEAVPPFRLDMESLGRSETLQQQYYSSQYNKGGRGSLFGLCSKLLSFFVPPLVGKEETQSFVPLPPPPKRYRVEGTCHQNYKAAAPPLIAVSHVQRELPHADGTSGAVFIPRMRPFCDLAIAALPFAAPLLMRFFCTSEVGEMQQTDRCDMGIGNRKVEYWDANALHGQGIPRDSWTVWRQKRQRQSNDDYYYADNKNDDKNNNSNTNARNSAYDFTDRMHRKSEKPAPFYSSMPGP